MNQILMSSSGFGYPPAEGRCEAGAMRGAEPHIDYRACANFGPLYATNR